MPRGKPTNVVNGNYGSQNPVTPAIYRAPQKPQTQQRGTAQQLEQTLDPQDPESMVRTVMQLQRNVDEATSQAKSGPFANGNLIKNVTVVQGTYPAGGNRTTVQHGLGRTPTGYFITKLRGGYVLYPVMMSADERTMSLWMQYGLLTGNTTCTMDIFVF